jgi:hypothetical protein
VQTRVGLANQLRSELERFWPGAAVISREVDKLSLIANPHVLDNRPLQAQQPRPYPCSAHVVPAPLGF